MKHVFISYSRKDTEFVERLERDLNDKGIITWRDQHSIPGGEEWFRAIKMGLENSRAMIYVDTINAETSKWVLKEYLMAEYLNLRIIPLRLDPKFMSMQTIELNPLVCDDANYDGSLVKISAILATLTTTPSTEPVAVSSSGRPQEELDYLRWVLIQAKADLRDSLYVNLLATPERPVAPKSALSFGLDDEFSFERLDLEIVRRDEFDKAGESVEDARTAIGASSRTLLLGDPGSGKTTTLLQLLVDLARAAETDPKEKLPLFVPLREFNGSMPFEAFVRVQMNNLQSAYDRLSKTNRLLLLCDALNEMPRRGADGRDLVAEVREYLRNTSLWVVSCRVRDYQEELKEFPELGKVRLKLLDLPRIQKFIQRRFREKPATGDALWSAMGGSEKLAIFWRQVSENGDVERFWDAHSALPGYTRGDADRAWRGMHAGNRMMLLCRSPYMTNMVCKLYELSGKLPENRGKLFGSFVDELLKREKRNCDQTGAAWIDDKVIRAGLAQLGFVLGTETELPSQEAKTIILQHLPDVDSALLLRLATAANLIEIGDSVRFTHQLLQEYFASEVLGTLMDADLEGAVKLWPADSWWEPNGREETAIILAGVRGDPEGVARWLAPAQPELAWRTLTESGIDVDTAALGEQTQKNLLSMAKRWAAKPKAYDRAAGYRLLERLKADTRHGIGVKNGLPDIAWTDPIPARHLVHKEDDSSDEINYSYSITKYPITNAQFQTFFDAENGYRRRDWWTDANWKLKDTFHNYADNERDVPSAFRLANHPYTTLFAGEIDAFCNWLTLQLSPLVWNTFRNSSTSTPPNNIWGMIRLPTAQEWEQAARGSDQRLYPWGNIFDAARCNLNTGEKPIGMTSAVGIFPDGASPYGVFDMIGNVWECCIDPKRKGVVGYFPDYSLHGGSWYTNRCDAVTPYSAAEAVNQDTMRTGIIGFRCAVTLP